MGEMTQILFLALIGDSIKSKKWNIVCILSMNKIFFFIKVT